MPEGHTIHRLARDHNRDLQGYVLSASSPQGRFVAAGALDGQRLLGAEARGKHLFHRYDGGSTLHVHLGLFGRFYRHAGEAPEPRGTTRLRLERPGLAVDLVGPTACELLSPEAEQRLLSRLGPDPIRSDADPERVWARLRRSKKPIGAALLDQSLVAGVGNVYRAEALFVTGIHPARSGASLTQDELDRLWGTLVRMLRQGVRQGRIVTVDPAERPRRRGGAARRDSLYVYRRPQCRRCGASVAALRLAGRSCYACETCQPPVPEGAPERPAREPRRATSEAESGVGGRPAVVRRRLTARRHR